MAQLLAPTTTSFASTSGKLWFWQYYGYSSEGSQSITFHDPDWEKLDYFVSSSETAFELCMLRKFDAELLLGQMSYSQKAEI